MPVPIIVAGAAAIAARLAAKKVAQEVAKKAAKAVAVKTTQIAKNSVKVKPAAKTKPKPPNPNQIEHKFGMRNNRMINQGVPVEARASGGGSRRDAIAESKLTGKPIKNTKPKLVMESVKVLPRKTAPKTDLSNRGAGKKNQRKADAIKKEATKENFYERIRNPIKINSAKPTKGSSDNFVEVPVKDSKYGEGPGVFVSRSVAARKPTRKPTRNPENPPKGTVVIKSSSPSYLRKKAIPMNKPVVKKTPRKFAPPKKK